jgi:quercetin dioxygenase-like cupin family protein
MQVTLRVAGMQPALSTKQLGGFDMTQSDPSRVLDFKGFPGRWEIERTGRETDGELLQIRFHIESTTGDSPPLHVHPDAEESYEVVSGVLDVNVEGDWQEVPAGNTHVVEPGTPHTFRNREPVEVINRHRPAMEYEQFFRRFHKLVIDEGVTLPPKGFKSFVYLGMLFSAHEKEVMTVKPPQFVMNGLSGLGKLLGYRLPDART